MLWLTPCWTKDSCRSVANCLNERRVAFRQLFLIFALKNRPLGGFFFWSEWLDSNLLSRRKFRARTALNNNASVTRFLNFSATPYAVWKSRQNFAFCGKNSRSNGCFCPQASSRSLVLLQKKPPIGRFFSFGRSDWTWTSDLYVPNVAFYQAELHSDNEAYIYHKK